HPELATCSARLDADYGVAISLCLMEKVAPRRTNLKERTPGTQPHQRLNRRRRVLPGIREIRRAQVREHFRIGQSGGQPLPAIERIVKIAQVRAIDRIGEVQETVLTVPDSDDAVFSRDDRMLAAAAIRAQPLS